MDDPSYTHVKDFVEVVEDLMDDINDESFPEVVEDSMDDTNDEDSFQVVQDSMDDTNDKESIEIVQDSMEDDDEANAGIMDSLDSIQGCSTNSSLRVTQDNNSHVVLNEDKRKKATGANYGIDLNKILEEVKWE
ncbi:hypothetical protein RJT34_12231 [Clitoria ternatea]|uniref:Uncharacterized protein n=1 Tax=Clitoria ternatea TaxID=43366 RepID=A0AAN9PKH1_CLITE